MLENYEKIDDGKVQIPICEKYMLTVREAAAYFSIGIKKMRMLAENNKGSFAILMGNRYLIVRPRFEAYIDTLMNSEENE